jgi:CRP-like cAMP-binding protein
VVPVVQRQVGVVQPLPLQIVRPGASPVRQGEVAATAWIVESGLLRMWAIDDSGRELMLDLLGPGDLVGEGDGAVSAWTVTSLKPGRLRPAVSGELAEARAARRDRITALACQLAWLGVRDRIEVRLAELASRIGRPVPGGILLPAMTQDDVASLVGTTRESANRALRVLVARDRLSVERPGRYVVHPRLHAVPR